MGKFKFLFRREEISDFNPKNNIFQTAFKLSNLSNSIEIEVPIAFTSEPSNFDSLFYRAKGIIIIMDFANLNIDFLLFMREHLTSIPFHQVPLNFAIFDDEDDEMSVEEKVLKKFKTIDFGSHQPIIVSLNKKSDDFDEIEKVVKSSIKI